MKTHYQWCVIGAGPAGITAINKLIVNNVNPNEIVWISNHFDCGDLGKKWIFVPANSNIASIRKYLNSCLNFNYNKLPASSKIRQLHEENFCHIIDIVEALQPIIKNLQNKVTTLQSIVLGISERDKYYLIKHRTNYKKEIYSKKIIIATGAIPLTQKSNKTRINLEIALNPKKLIKLNIKNKNIAIFGGSHSAILAIINCLNQGANVINFYKHPLRYAKKMQNTILFDNTGLKGEVATWAKNNLHGQKINCQRIYYLDKQYNKYLKECTHIIDAIGFKPRILKINNAKHKYCPYTGIISDRIFGLGIGYPEKITSPLGYNEYNIGLKKFSDYLDRVFPLWISS